MNPSNYTIACEQALMHCGRSKLKVDKQNKPARGLAREMRIQVDPKPFSSP